VPGSALVLEPLAEDAARERLAQMKDYYDARRQALGTDQSGAPYKPLPPDRLYLTEAEWAERLAERPLARMTPFAVPEARGVVEIGTRQGRNFAAERAADANVFDAVAGHVHALQAANKRVVIALWSEGARDRMHNVLADHRLSTLVDVASWQGALARPKSDVALAVLGLEAGFETEELALIGEQDILGDRLVRPRRAARRAADFI